MSKIASFLTNYIVQKGVIEDEDRNMYKYGFTILLELGLVLIISFCIASWFHMVLEGILFFLIFIPLRSYAGGLHLDRYGYCLVLSSLIFAFILLISKFVEVPSYIALILLFFLEIAILLMYPVEHENRQVDKKESHYFKMRLKIFLFIDSLLAILCAILERQEYLLVITATFFMVAVTMMLGKYRYYRLIYKE